MANKKPSIGEKTIQVSEETMALPQLDGIDCEIMGAKQVDFTEELATKFLSMEVFSGERPIRDAWVEALITEAKKGMFRPELASLIAAHCEWDKKVRRLNGQHTCWMRLYMPASWSCKIEVIHYRVKTEEDFRRLYTVIDSGAVRTMAHKINARLVGSEAMQGIDGKYMRMIAAAVKVYRDEAHLDANELADLIESDLNKLVFKTFSFLSDKHIFGGRKGSRHMRRAAVIAAIMATTAKSQSDAVEFWSRVLDGVGMTATKDPRLKLRDYLLRAAIKSSGEGTIVQKHISAEELYRACLLAWNRYREGLAGGDKDLGQISVGNTVRRPKPK